MKAIIVGGGSIGGRHLQNLKKLGVTDLALVEPDAGRREQLARATGATGFPGLEEALIHKPDFVLIASPSSLHVEQALAIARRGCHLFIEKPLAISRDGLADLEAEIRSRGLISLVGCNMRFHPGPALVKSLLDEERIGRVLFARLHSGSYLPQWRPGQDYRQGYSASARLGGGCILDCIHEIDLARWYLGDAIQVFCAAGHQSSLQIDVEDVAMLVCRHAQGRLAQIELDYVQRAYDRGCHIVGERGTIDWDYVRGTVHLYSADRESWETTALPQDWQANQMYLDEMRHFLTCVQTRTATTLPISEAVKVLGIALAAKEAVRTGSWVSPERILECSSPSSKRA